MGTGGSYGGYGGNSAYGCCSQTFMAACGSFEWPVVMGSGGVVSASGAPYVGAKGGGALRIVANVSAAFYGLQLIDVPLFLCVRRLTSLCVLVTEFLVLRKVSSRPVMASILLVMAGTILAGYESLSSYLIGYIYVMMNNILTALLYTWVRDVAGEGPVQAPGASARCAASRPRG